MNILNHNDINILDLPDEMLLTIFNKLNTIDMLYSLVDVNQQFDRLALDSRVIDHLNFVIKRDDIHSSSVEIDILSRICSKILPRINEKIIKLILESHSMERIINAIDYPRLHSLSLVNYQPKILLRHLSDNTKKLLKLKHFSLATDFYTSCYDTEVVPLLRRMLNLEELTLFLSVVRSKSTYIDGNQLYDKVLNYMSQLNKFIFNIHTRIMNDFIINNNIKIDLPSNDDIRNSFIKRGFKSIDTCADDKLINNRGNCHVYSLPYQFNEFLFMNSCFQGGKFDKVRLLTMFDIRPFEHELFKIISQDFPFLQQLHICNNHRQINEHHHSSTLITFNYLFKLHLYAVHKDYVIQFLSDKNTRLPCLTNLIIEYKTLVAVTNNFTNDATRLNCSKIKYLVTYEPFVRSQNFVAYFPSL
ncbi:unnamed protein product [Rotaria sordida]|uniref:F-box domain-containing protein n=1 Tax=Rotaria sordida TaxID=392033 RepID=A0A813ZQ74_9BILA|nr:unnamed protein product [Rotaria sordida]CAF0924183.1 unnamed protein product [Rotaria sordida]